MKIDTAVLAGTSTLAALVVVLDYTVKYSNLKIPFPWLPYLKFDFTGIPIIVSTLLFGLVPGTITSIIASVAILARSGDVVGSSMKGLAEFSTCLGLVVGIKLFKRFRLVGCSVLGITSRVFIMGISNWALIYAGAMLMDPSFASIPFVWSVLIALFNVMQGILSVGGGYFVYVAIRRRAPSLLKKQARTS
jgi:riboflavin transporter FmnP